MNVDVSDGVLSAEKSWSVVADCVSVYQRHLQRRTETAAAGGDPRQSDRGVPAGRFRLAAMTAAKPDAPESFAALDMRVGRIVTVEEFPEARNPAWKLRIDFGPLGERQSSAQITHYSAEELTDRPVVCAVNLGRKRIAGFVSECLVLGAVDDIGTVRLLRPDDGARPGDPIA
jgi:tRNA-binding protein